MMQPDKDPGPIPGEPESKATDPLALLLGTVAVIGILILIALLATLVPMMVEVILTVLP